MLLIHLLQIDFSLILILFQLLINIYAILISYFIQIVYDLHHVDIQHILKLYNWFNNQIINDQYFS